MIGEAAIILANMRGGYANVGATVHTLFRMSRRPGSKTGSSESSHSSSVPTETPESILGRLETSR
jgi:hypothetical protein